MEIKDILKADEFENLSQFTNADIDWLNKRINTRKDGKPGVECIVRGMNTDGDYFELKPEEVVRQLYAHLLMEKYEYPKELLEFEVPAMFAGRSCIIDDKRIDIAIYSDTTKKKFRIIIEVKRPEVKDENARYGTESTTPYEQMNSYCSNKHAEVGVIANGANLCKFYSKKDDYTNALTLSRFPAYKEKLDEWLESRRFTLKQLMIEDRLEKETLKEIILNVEQKFSANESSEKEFEEVFKLIFSKLYDEKKSSDDADGIAGQIKYGGKKLADIDDSHFRALEFRAREGESLDEIYNRIETLFNDAKKEWSGVFRDDAKLNMKKATVKSCVKELQSVKLFNSNLEVVDDAFEYLINLNQKKEMSQFFTPRYVIDMCVKMLNPTSSEKMIDTAAGSCGFPMHTIFHVWNIINPSAPNLFTTTKRSTDEQNYVRDNVFGIDFSEPSVRVGRMINIIAGDGHTNILELNTLDFLRWDAEYVSSVEWLERYNEGFQRFKKLQTKGSLPYKEFDFDIVMANPPFSGELDNLEQLKQYEFSKNAKGEQQLKANKAILFLERNLQFLKPGGRMAIVLPQGIFNNSSLQYIREAILDKCRLLAVVGLHGNVFKPHTGTKTSVLLVQKWTENNCGYPNICPKPDADADGNIDYPIFFATMQEASKDNSGEKIYVTENYIKWRNYNYFTERIYIRKSDFKSVSKEEFDKAKKKSDYWVKDKTSFNLTEHANLNGETRFIKDLFIEKYGALDSHRKWIRKNVCFVLKNKKANPTSKPEISLFEFLKLDIATQGLYKEKLILGNNTNPLITKDEYDALSAMEKKYCLVAEEIIETSERIKDTHGHIFVKHDLFNQDPQLQNKNPHNVYAQNGIAEAFAKFAYDQRLSFAPKDKELQKILHPKNELPF